MPKAMPKPEFRTKKGTGRITLTGVDGRSQMARRYREIHAQIEADMGGDMSEAQRAIASRAVTLAVWCESAEAELAQGGEFSVQEYATVANAMRRLLCDLGLERKAKDITGTLASYLASKG